MLVVDSSNDSFPGIIRLDFKKIEHYGAWKIKLELVTPGCELDVPEYQRYSKNKTDSIGAFKEIIQMVSTNGIYQSITIKISE